MSTDDRFSEDKDKHFELMKDRVDESDELSNSDMLKRANITQRKGTKAYSIKYTTINKCCSIRIEQRQLEVDQTEFYSLIDDLYKQLDGKWIQDSKDHSWVETSIENELKCVCWIYMKLAAQNSLSIHLIWMTKPNHYSLN